MSAHVAARSSRAVSLVSVRELGEEVPLLRTQALRLQDKGRRQAKGGWMDRFRLFGSGSTPGQATGNKPSAS